MNTQFPLVGLPADTYMREGFLYHSLGDKYVRAVADVAQCLPLMIPSIIDSINMDALLAPFDGILITGAVSNIHPPHYGEDATEDHEPYDHHRDAMTLKLIEAVVSRGIPLFCICRGFQELNVVLGGSLETELQRGKGRLDHRAPDDPDVNKRYGPSHKVTVTPGGFLDRLLNTPEFMVNSIHRQGIKRLAARLEVEARAPDGIIEAVTVKGAKSFAFATQWHPEFKTAENPVSTQLFEAFGQAVRAHARGRQQPSARLTSALA